MEMKEDALQMKGLAVHDIDDTKVGDVVDFFIDGSTKEPEWIVVEAGLVDKKTALVPLDGMTREEQVLKTPYPKDMIMSAPEVRGTSIDKDTEEALYGYYHVRRELPGRTEKKAAYEQDRSETGDARLRSWKSSAA